MPSSTTSSSPSCATRCRRAPPRQASRRTTSASRPGRSDPMTVPLLPPPYRSTVLRAPSQPLVVLPHRLTELTGPLLTGDVGPHDHDLTAGHAGEPIGQRIVVLGRVRDADGRAVPDALVEVWQAN